jgi:hypothetical protein
MLRRSYLDGFARQLVGAKKGQFAVSSEAGGLHSKLAKSSALRRRFRWCKSQRIFQPR